jgi:hypothetical protein
MTKISEKVHSAIRLSPCFIDYAINFGIRNVETQWRENLVRNNNLALPVALKINGSGQVSDNYCTAKRDEIKFS